MKTTADLQAARQRLAELEVTLKQPGHTATARLILTQSLELAQADLAATGDGLFAETTGDLSQPISLWPKATPQTEGQG